jgi:hypothetical protein
MKAQRGHMLSPSTHSTRPCTSPILMICSGRTSMDARGCDSDRSSVLVQCLVCLAEGASWLAAPVRQRRDVRTESVPLPLGAGAVAGCKLVEDGRNNTAASREGSCQAQRRADSRADFKHTSKHTHIVSIDVVVSQRACGSTSGDLRGCRCCASSCCRCCCCRCFQDLLELLALGCRERPQRVDRTSCHRSFRLEDALLLLRVAFAAWFHDLSFLWV